MTTELLQIIIPTLNRVEPLIKNLKNIQQYIVDNNLNDEISIIISDNNSDISLYNKLQNFLNDRYRVKYKLYRQEKNIGIEKNVLFLLENSSAKYVMTLGDDDYFSEKYLLDVVKFLRTGLYTGIIPNYKPVDILGNQIAPLRDPISSDKVYDKNSLWISDRGHQLSCLVFQLDGLLDSYKKNVRPNVYPFVYFLAYNLMRGQIVHITREPFDNTLISKKNWNYDNDNLMGELSIVFCCLPYRSSTERRNTLKILLKRNADRYSNKRTWFRPFWIMNRIDHYDISEDFRIMMKRYFYLHMVKRVFTKIVSLIFKSN